MGIPADGGGLVDAQCRYTMHSGSGHVAKEQEKNFYIFLFVLT